MTDATNPKRIRGYWRDCECHGKPLNTATATYYGNGEWQDDRFGVCFAFSSILISKTSELDALPEPEAVAADLVNTFWSGCERVEIIEETEDTPFAVQETTA